MAAVERDGYIVQPHTSAGRIPTEDAYKLHLKKIKLKKQIFITNYPIIT